MGKIQNIIDFIRGKKTSVSLKNKFYGEIYTPHYPQYLISSNEPVIYNCDGQRMRSFFLRDRLLSAIPTYMQSKYFLWDRYNLGLKTHFYSHNSMLETMGKPDKRYGIMFESEAITPRDYQIFKKYKGLEKDFDAIFTYNEEILETIPNAKFYPSCASSWYGFELGGGEISDTAYLRKTKNVSIMASNKAETEYHKFRKAVALKLKTIEGVDTYGNFDKEGTYAIAPGKLPDKLENALRDYRFSFAIENDVKPYFFTEKLISCFAAMTIPIYLGATKIDKFFNPDGIIKISLNDIDKVEDIVKSCTEKEYNNRLEAVKDNFERAKAFFNANDWLFENYFAK